MAVTIWKFQVVLLAILGVCFLGENVTLMGAVGILVSISGIYLLNVYRAQISLLQPIWSIFKEKGMRFALLAAFTLAPAILLFKKTALLGDPYFSTLTNYTFASLLTIPLMIRKSAKHLALLPRYFWRFFGSGLFCCLSHYFWFFWVHSLNRYLCGSRETD